MEKTRKYSCAFNQCACVMDKITSFFSRKITFWTIIIIIIAVAIILFMINKWYKPIVIGFKENSRLLEQSSPVPNVSSM